MTAVRCSRTGEEEEIRKGFEVSNLDGVVGTVWRSSRAGKKLHLHLSRRTNNERTTSRIKAKVHRSVQERYGDTSRDKQDTRHVCAKRGGGVGAGLSDVASPCAQQDRHGDNECKRQDVSSAERRIGDREV